MSQDSPTARRLVVARTLSHFLRSAGRIVERADSFQADIRLECQEIRANGKSILDLVVLIAECGPTFECVIEAHGPDAEEAATALAALIGDEFEESGPE